MSTNINEGQTTCLFCYCSTFHYRQAENDVVLNQIVTTCNKHLPQECIVNINWENVNSADESFCQECYNLAEQLLTLNSDLDRILKDIEGLSANFANRISSGRRNNELSSTLFHNVIAEYRNVENTSALSMDNRPNDTTSSANCPDLTSKVSQNVYNADLGDINVCKYNKSNEDDLDDTSVSIEDNPSSQTNVNHNKKPGKFKRSRKRNNKNPTEESAERTPTITTGSDVQRHIDNDIASGFQCEKCHKRFSRLTILQKHDCSKRTFECEVCNKSFSGTGVLKLHMRCHTGEKPFKCNTCGKSFSVRCHLNTHLRVHSEERPFKCDICEKTFKDVGNLKKHNVIHYKSEQKFKCDICFKSFPIFFNLKQHLSLHKEERPFKCSRCGKGFYKNQSLQLHERMHSGEKPFKCELCEKSFGRKDLLTKHVETHSTDRGFLCEECGKSFTTTKYLAIHTLTHTEKGPFVCETCGKQYPSSVRLKSHIRYYHSEKTIKCESCNIIFKSQSELVKHQEFLDCQGGPPFVCNQCDKSFSNKICRQRHIAVEHLSENERENFQCDVCQKIFHVRRDLYDHKRLNRCQNLTVSKANEGVFCGACENHFEDVAKFESHHSKRNMPCHFCPKRLHSTCEYNFHRQKTHPNGESLYKCKICSVPCAGLTYLRIHMKSSHAKESTVEEESDIEESIPSSSSMRTRSTTKRNSKKVETNTGSSSEEEEKRDNAIEKEDSMNGEHYNSVFHNSKVEIKIEDEFLIGF